MQLICEIVPNRQASTDELQALGRALVEWKQRILPARGLSGHLVSEALNDLLSGELPTPTGILIANAARSILQQSNLDAAVRAYLAQLAEHNWDEVNVDRRGMDRRTVCGVITLGSEIDADSEALQEEHLPSEERIREAVRSLAEVLPRRAVHSVQLKRLVRDTGQILRIYAEQWRDDGEWSGELP